MTDQLIDAVRQAWERASHIEDDGDAAEIAVDALHTELTKQGFAIVNAGSVPPWMESAPCGCGCDRELFRFCEGLERQAGGRD